MRRVPNLDYLRGSAAFAVMIYHYQTWSYGPLDPSSVLGKLGIYAVSIFYILSGLTLCLVYTDMEPTFEEIKKFWIKRFFRIFPLMWLVMFVSICLSRDIPDLSKLALNVTGLFGFFSWNSYIGTGIWSIGNELTFYALFCLIVLLINRSAILFFALAFLTFVIYVTFAFYLFDPGQSLESQWTIYTNPLNQAFLFVSGVLIGYLFKNVAISNMVSVALVLASALLFVFIGAASEPISLVTGVNRLIFTFCSIIFCLSVYKIEIRFPDKIESLFNSLGESSYSLYLLHPIVWSIFGFIINRIPYIHQYVTQPVRFFACICISLFVSHMVYKRYETLFIRKGKYLVQNV
jgi:exopolysaccharide production protein ExoZ